MDDNHWTDARLASLDPAAGWRPDASRALSRFRRRRAGVKRRNWVFVLAAAALSLFAFGEFSPRACANPRGCLEPPAAPPSPATPAAPDFKQTGSPNAPITIEVFSDYECPSCAALFRDTMPLLLAAYVKSGSVKLIHRDFPLPQHPYARRAARYANAAGAMGRYDVVVARLFETQQVWSQNGDIAASLAPVLSPDEMRKVQQSVENDAHLDDTVNVDLAEVQKYQIGHTPTLVVTYKGRPQVLPGVPAFAILKAYLDSLVR